MSFCIPRESAVKLASKLKALGDDPFGALESMTSSERRALFKSVLSDADARAINAKLEEAFMQENKDAVLRWAKKNLTPQKQKEVVSEISEFEKSIKSGNVYEDLVNKKLGVELSTKEVKEFTRLGKQVFEAGERLEKAGGELGDLLDTKTLHLQNDYFKKLDDLARYTESISPRSGSWKTFIQYSAKTAMLGAFKSFFLNIQGNTLTALTESITRRLINKNFGGRLGKEKALYTSRATKLFNNSRFDVARSTGLRPEDSVIGAGKFAGEAIATPQSGLLRKYGEFIFDKALGVPDVAFGAYHFADNAGVMAQKLAKGNRKLEREIFIDATKLNPKTDAGAIVREVSIHNARVGTFTNEGELAKASMEIKRTINKAGQLGEIVMPFVKTPTNVISMAGDFAGVGLTRPMYRFAKKLTAGEPLTEKEIVDNWTALIRAGMGLSVATAILASVDIDDYIGAYNPSDTQKRNIKGATPDSVKIGDNYISLDYFGPFRSMMKVGLELRARESVAEAFYNTANSEFRNLPVVGGVEDIAKTLGRDELGQATKKIDDKLVKFFTSRLLPAQVGDIAKATDEAKRDISTRQYGAFDPLVQKIPYLRKTLPKKVTVLGEDQELPSSLKVLFFGARVSEAITNDITKEYMRLEKAGFTPKFTDLTYTRSKKVERVADRIGKEAMIKEKKEMGKKISADLKEVLISKKYLALADEDKKDFIKKVNDNRYNEFLKKYGEKHSKVKSIDSLIGRVSKSKKESSKISKKDQFVSLSKSKQQALIKSLIDKGFSKEEIRSRLID